MAATTSSTCSGFFGLRSSNSVESRVRDTSSSSGCGGKLDGVAMWFINGVTMAFFASLNHCSCIRIATDEEDGDDANDLPLMFNDGNLRHDGVTAATTRKRTGNNKGKKKSEAALVDED